MYKWLMWCDVIKQNEPEFANNNFQIKFPLNVIVLEP